MFAINRAILRALGMQWHIAAVVVVGLWCGALPTIIYKAVYLNEGLDAVWTILPIAYAIMQVLLLISYSRVDWKHISESIQHEMPTENVVERRNDVEMVETLNLIST